MAPAERTPAAVIDVGWVNGLAAVRSLGRAGIPVFAVDHRPSALGFRSRYGERVLVPDPVGDEEGYVGALKALAARTGGPLPIFPTHDPGLNALARHLDESFLAPFPSWDTLAAVQSKRAQLERAAEVGVGVPETRHPGTAAEARAAAEELGFPVLVKPSDPIGFKRRFRRQAFRCTTTAEVEDAYGRAEEFEPMVQELVPGGDDELYSVGSYLARDGRALGLFCGRKLVQTPPGVGTCRVGEAVWVEEVVDAALSLLRAFDFHGISQVEFKRDPPRRPLQADGDQPAPLAMARARGGVRRRHPADRVRGSRRRGAPGGADERRRKAVGDHAPSRGAAGVPAASVRRRRVGAGRPQAGVRPPRPPRPVVIPEGVQRRARWVLETVGARDLRLGDDLPFRPEAWEQVDRGERPEGDDLAEAFFHLARVEERGGPRDEHGRFRAEWSALDPLDPPVERLRRALGVEPPRWRDARFAVALTHDVDTPWRWTRSGLRGGASRLKGHVLSGEAGPALREARSLAAVPVHRLRGTDPNWRFEELLAEERARGAASTFFVLAGHGDPHDGARPETYERLRPRLVETVIAHGGEVGLHGTYRSADEPARLRHERDTLAEVMSVYTDITRGLGHRFHYLRLDPHRNLRALDELGFSYDSTLGFPDAVGFRAGIAQPFRPWDLERDEPFDLIEIPLAAMEVTLAEARYLGLSADEAWPHLERLLDWAAEHGGGFAVLWHPDRFDPATSAGWNRLYYRLIDEAVARGGVCLTAGELAEEARSWLGRAST